MILALSAAISGAVAYGIGSVLQAVAASRTTGTAVVRHPLYLLGIGCDILAFVASLVALHGLPLFAVQSVLAGSLGVTVLLARVVLGTPIRRRVGAALIAVVAALVVLALASGTQAARPTPGGFGTAMLLATGGAAVLLLTQYRRGDPTRLALLAGVSFAGSAIGARALDLSNGAFAAATSPIPWMIIGLGVIGSLAYARSLEYGAAGPSTAIVWVVEVLLSGLVGLLVLGDHVQPGWALPALGACAVAVLGCVVLAQAQPAEPDEGSTQPLVFGRLATERLSRAEHGA